MFFIKTDTATSSFKIGVIVYIIGVILFAIATISFAKPNANGINQSGLYRISRNPMYISYFIYFLGCVLLTHSIILLILLFAFQISSHWIILAEERWCIQTFQDKYVQYMKKVRRYI